MAFSTGVDETIAQELWAHLQAEHAKAESDVSFDLPKPDEVSEWEGKLGWLKGWMQQTHKHQTRPRLALTTTIKLNKLNRSGSNKAKEVRDSVIAFDSSMEELRNERARNHVQLDLLQSLTSLEKRKSELLKSSKWIREYRQGRCLERGQVEAGTFVSAFKEKRRQNLEVRFAMHWRTCFTRNTCSIRCLLN